MWCQAPGRRIKLCYGSLARPMRGLRADRTAQVVIAGLAFTENLSRGHCQLGTETARHLQVAATFTELAQGI